MNDWAYCRPSKHSKSAWTSSISRPVRRIDCSFQYAYHSHEATGERSGCCRSVPIAEHLLLLMIFNYLYIIIHIRYYIYMSSSDGSWWYTDIYITVYIIRWMSVIKKYHGGKRNQWRNYRGRLGIYTSPWLPLFSIFLCFFHLSLYQ